MSQLYLEISKCLDYSVESTAYSNSTVAHYRDDFCSLQNQQPDI